MTFRSHNDTIIKFKMIRINCEIMKFWSVTQIAWLELNYVKFQRTIS